MEELGRRVRIARQQNGLSARKLSGLSGVSLRYLSLLENGKGNVSIALLYKIAVALNCPLESLVEPQSSSTSLQSDLCSAFDNASPEIRRQIKSLLSLSSTDEHKARRIALIGLRGAGKSTLGKAVTTELDSSFLELNHEIENHAGMKLAELINFYGHEGYRKLEQDALERVAKSTDSIVLAVAGGVVSSPESFQFLRENFYTVWLKASPEEHMERVQAQGDSRPMAGNPAAMEELKSILTSREKLYADADFTVDTSGQNEKQSLQALLAVVQPLTSPE
ncbi:MAG: helix-turn-helix transcriptional regulator [Gammaproteobacteria bacterium]|nr:helix-turn-helix transcriptional regulator [Gammaproteobacteria bacterium]